MVNIVAEALESVHGRSAVGLLARLEALVDNEWVILAECKTDEKGRIEEWGGTDGHRGLYRIVFNIDRYFTGLGMTPAYPEVTTTIRTSEDGAGHRVNLTFSPHDHSVVFTAE